MLPHHTRERIFAWLRSRAALVLTAALIVTALLAVPFLTLAPEDNASQEPGGAVFEARDRIEERFVSGVLPIPVVIEAVDGSILEKGTLTDLLAAESNLRDDPDLGPTLLNTFDPDSGLEVHGLVTVADLIDDALPAGVAGSSQAEIDATAAEIIDALGAESPTLSLSVSSTYDQATGTWVVPAITTFVLADNDVLGYPTGGVVLGTDTEPEQYKRDVVAALSSEAGSYEHWGVAIDVNLTSEEQGETAGPFIGLTILAVLVVVAVAFRSYWVMAVSGGALAALIIWLYGIANLVGLKGDLILSLVVPIAMISFGIDFTFHSVGRYREERDQGLSPRASFVVGMTGVAGALTLALTSDVVAFLSNTVSGIESIIQFGIGTAIALTAAYVLLGVVTPLAVSVIDTRLGSRPTDARSTAIRIGGSALAAMFAMTVALLLVFIAPAAGVVAFFAYVALAIALPVAVSRPGAIEAGTTRGPGTVSRRLGTVVVALTRQWKVVIAGAAVVTGIAAYFAVQVPTEFDVKDFFSADTDFVVSLDKVDQHLGERGGEPAAISIEADITDPGVVAAIAAFEADIRDSGAGSLASDSSGVRTTGGVAELIDDVWASPVATAVIAERSGIEITDTDGDGVPDSSDQLRALYAVTSDLGVPLDGARHLRTPDTVGTDIWLSPDGSEGATVITVDLLDTARQENIVAARSYLAPLTDGLQEELRSLDADAQVVVTGGPIVRQESLEGVSRALAWSLPLSVVLCVIIAAAFMRSLRLGVVSVVPILMTVAMLYGFMYLAGYSINIVTATIGAISIGIGIDFAIHYAMRFREELAEVGERIEAVRRASEGTGVALLASAASSVIGFGILALAPMPLFASYGLLTAVMIAMAAGATLLVLPSLLVAVSRDRSPVDDEPLERELVTV